LCPATPSWLPRALGRPLPFPILCLRNRLGFTLLEVSVALAVLVLVAALSAPALGHLPQRGGGTLAGLAARARGTAVRRASALELRVDSAGIWSLTAPGDGDAVVDRGRLSDTAAGAVTLRISALGTCVVVDPAGVASPSISWDALRCVPLSAPVEAGR
jgi:prepilin-type N-terminal cleavage/methylation domain-containing protein